MGVGVIFEDVGIVCFRVLEGFVDVAVENGGADFWISLGLCLHMVDGKHTVTVDGFAVFLHLIFLQRLLLSILQRRCLGGHLLGKCTSGLHVAIMCQKLSNQLLKEG